MSHARPGQARKVGTMKPRRASSVPPFLLLVVVLVGGCIRFGAAAADAVVPAGGAAAGDGGGGSAAALLAPRRALQEILTEGDTVVNGVLNLLTTEGVAACEGACAGAFAGAFGVDESSIGCLCPSSNTTTAAAAAAIGVNTGASTRRRGLFLRDNNNDVGPAEDMKEGEEEESGSRRNRRGLRGLAELDESQPLVFSARVPGGLEGGAAALELFSESMGAVASAFGVQESEVCM